MPQLQTIRPTHLYVSCEALPSFIAPFNSCGVSTNRAPVRAATSRSMPSGITSHAPASEARSLPMNATRGFTEANPQGGAWQHTHTTRRHLAKDRKSSAARGAPAPASSFRHLSKQGATHHAYHLKAHIQSCGRLPPAAPARKCVQLKRNAGHDFKSMGLCTL